MDQLTEWERRNEEYEGESLETFSDGMKIAVLASHAPESIRNVVRLAAGPAKGKNQGVRPNISEFLQFGRIFDKHGRRVESEPNHTGPFQMDVDSVGEGTGKTKGCFVSGRPGHAAKDCKLNQGRGKGQTNGKGKGTLDKHSPAKFEGERHHCGKKGHKWTDCQMRLAEATNKKVHAVGTEEAPSTATVAAVEDTGEIDEEGWPDDDTDTAEIWVFSVEDDDTPADGKFLPLDSACEEHTCLWSFSAGGHDLGPSNVQLINANGLSIPSGRKVMVLYDVLGPGGRVVLHAQTPFVQSDAKRPLLSVGKLTDQGR